MRRDDGEIQEATTSNIENELQFVNLRVTLPNGASTGIQQETFPLGDLCLTLNFQAFHNPRGFNISLFSQDGSVYPEAYPIKGMSSGKKYLFYVETVTIPRCIEVYVSATGDAEDGLYHILTISEQKIVYPIEG